MCENISASYGNYFLLISVVMEAYRSEK